VKKKDISPSKKRSPRRESIEIIKLKKIAQGMEKGRF
jgi:hypothetical protein